LDAACRRLVELKRAPAEYYAADMLPDVPDDLAGEGLS